MVAVIGVFALDPQPLFHVSPSLHTTSALMVSFAGMGFKRVGDKLHGGPGLNH